MISSAFAQGAGASFSLLSSPHIRNTRRGECITMLLEVLDSLTHRRVVAYRSVYLTCGFIEMKLNGFRMVFSRKKLIVVAFFIIISLCQVLNVTTTNLMQKVLQLINRKLWFCSNSPFSYYLWPHFRSESRCSPFYMNKIFHSHAN